MSAYTFKIIDNPADPTFNQLLGINISGEIVGYFGSGMAGHPNKGYTTNTLGKAFTAENYPLSVQTQVTGVNDEGWTVGFEIDAAGNSYGFLDMNGAFTLIADPLAPATGGVVNEQVLGVNDSGLAVGFYTNAAGAASAFSYNAATNAYKPLTIAGATSVTATGVDQRGDISGFYTNAAGAGLGFVELASNQVITVSGRIGWTNIQVLGINDAGLVVGSYVNAAGNTDGFTLNLSDNHYQSFSRGAGTQTVLNGVNDRGQIVGFTLDGAGNTHGLLLQPPAPAFNLTFTTLDDTADPTFNQLLSINNAGEIAGYFGSGAAGHPNQGYLLTNDTTFSPLNFPGSMQTQETGINNSGATVGFEVDAAGNSVGFFQRNGGFHSILDPNAPAVGGVVAEQLLGLNDRGMLAGFYVKDAAGDAVGFTYNRHTGAFTNVSIAGATSVTATDVNDSNVVSGFYTTNGQTLGFLDFHGRIETIAGLIGDSNVQVLGLNNNGLAVGSFQDSAGKTEGFLYQMDSHTFNPIVAPGNAGETVLNGVNDLNQIAGFYLDGGGNTHGLLVKT